MYNIQIRPPRLFVCPDIEVDIGQHETFKEQKTLYQKNTLPCPDCLRD